MAVTLTATQLTGADPRPVQITLNGTSTGQAYEVRGTTADGSSWAVPGGKGVSAGAQVVLIDNRSALNAVVVYQAVVDGATFTASPVTIAGPFAVLQSIDGLTVVPVEIKSRTESRKGNPRAALFEIAGRADPASRLDVAGSPAYSWELETQGSDSVTMLAILASGLPVVRRTVTGVRDLSPVVIGIVTSWSDELSSEGFDTWRTWKLEVREIADPQPSTPLIAFLWDDFDTAMSDRVWSWHSVFPSLSGWAATNATLSLVTTGGYSTPNYARATASAAAAVDILESAYSAAASSLGSPVAAGDVITHVCRVRGTAGRTASAAIKWSGGTVVTGTPVTLTGAWQLASVTATAPAGTTGLAMGARMAATGVAAGNQLEYSAPTVSRGATVPTGTFDELFALWDAFDVADWSLL